MLASANGQSDGAVRCAAIVGKREAATRGLYVIEKLQDGCRFKMHHRVSSRFSLAALGSRFTVRMFKLWEPTAAI